MVGSVAEEGGVGGGGGQGRMEGGGEVVAQVENLLARAEAMADRYAAASAALAPPAPSLPDGLRRSYTTVITFL